MPLYRGSDGAAYLIDDESLFDPEGELILTGLTGERRATAERVAPYKLDEEGARALVAGKMQQVGETLQSATKRLNAFAEEVRMAGVRVAEGGIGAPGGPGPEPERLAAMLKEAFAAVPGASGPLAPVVGVVETVARVTSQLEAIATSASDPTRLAAIEAQLADLLRLAQDTPLPDDEAAADALEALVKERLTALWTGLAGSPPPAPKPERASARKSPASKRPRRARRSRR